MKINFINTIIAGVIAGILIGGMQILGCCCWPVDILLLIVAGAVAVHLSASTIGEQNDALITGAIAGFIGGLIGGILYAIMAVVIQVLFGTISLMGSSDPNSSLAGSGASTLFSGIGAFLCCLPTFIVAGVVLGALGGLLYTMIKK